MNGFNLLPQIILFLVLVDILAHHRVYLFFKTGNFKLVVEHRVYFAQSVNHPFAL